MHASSSTPRVLLLFYSFSGQTAKLLGGLAAGLRQESVQVELEKVRPVPALRFPVGSIPATLGMMLTTFCRRRVPIQPLSAPCRAGAYDLIILAGPTWSYNPSGPILSLLDRDGPVLLAGQRVLPLISCRGYWRLHWFGLQRLLRRCGARVENRMIFAHPLSEPWRTVGVFLKIAGRKPEAMAWLGDRYPFYGHGRRQQAEALRFGREIGAALRSGKDLAELDFSGGVAKPGA